MAEIGSKTKKKIMKMAEIVGNKKGNRANGRDWWQQKENYANGRDWWQQKENYANGSD